MSLLLGLQPFSLFFSFRCCGHRRSAEDADCPACGGGDAAIGAGAEAGIVIGVLPGIGLAGYGLHRWRAGRRHPGSHSAENPYRTVSVADPSSAQEDA